MFGWNDVCKCNNVVFTLHHVCKTALKQKTKGKALMNVRVCHKQV